MGRNDANNNYDDNIKNEPIDLFFHGDYNNLKNNGLKLKISIHLNIDKDN